MAVPGGFKQPVRNVSSSDAEFGRFCNYVKLFFGFFHISCVCTAIDHLVWIRFGALEKYYVLLQLVCLRCGPLPDELPQELFRCVAFVCALMYFPFSHCIL